MLPPADTLLRAQPLMRPRALLYFYRRRLRVHAMQELLAGVGVAIAVALAFASMVASTSIAGSAEEVVRAVIGPATLQLQARGPQGVDEGVLARVEQLPGVAHAAPLLEQTATLSAPSGHTLTVDLAGADTSLVVLDGLAHTLPTKTLQAGGIGLSLRSAHALGVPAGSPLGFGSGSGAGTPLTLRLRGRATALRVSAVLGKEAFGALAQAQVAVMPLEDLQRLAGLTHRISRVLVQAKPGRQAQVARELRALAHGTMNVASADQDVAQLRQALRPSDQASAFFATVSALLGLLLAGSALLLTVPERRRTIADLRLIGAKRTAIAQMFLFQALCLGVLASLAGLAGGYALSLRIFHQSPRYLAEAFTLGTSTVVGAQPVVLALAGGVLATCAVSALPLLDLRRGAALDAVYRSEGVPGNALAPGVQRALALTAGALLAAATALFAIAPAHALLACALLALATVLALPLVLAGALAAAGALAERRQTLTLLPVALASLRSTTLRSLALAATGAVALFGSVALGGARSDLLRGIEGFAHAYSKDAPVWVGSPGDDQAVVDFRAPGLAARIARLPGVARVSAFQGGFLTLPSPGGEAAAAQSGGRRVWVLARPPGGARSVLASQMLEGDASSAERLLSHRGWVVVSRQIAQEHHARLGGQLTLPTPSGPVTLRVAATTTNLAWSPGVVFLGSSEYQRLWRSTAPTALAVTPALGVGAQTIRAEVAAVLGPRSGLLASTAPERERSIDALTSEGLRQLQQISLMLLAAAVLALAAALTSAIWSRRPSLAGLRLAGVRPRRLRAILMCEAALMLGAGCLTGALAGIYGQFAIDGYLRHVTGFPVASLSATLRPLEVLALVLALALALVAIPGYLASRVSPTLAFNE